MLRGKMKIAHGKKKGRGKRPAVDNLLPGNADYVSQSENILCALDERIEDIERRGRTRKKRSNFTNKPQTRRANSLPPNNVSCPFEKNRDCCLSSANKSVHFQACCYGNHMPTVSKQSPPPRQRKSSMKKASGDATNKFPREEACKYHADKHYMYKHSPCKSANNIYSSNISNVFAPNYSGDVSGVRVPYMRSFEPNSSYSVSTGMYRNKLRPSSHIYKPDMMIDDLMVKYSEFKIPCKPPSQRLSSATTFNYGMVPRQSLVNASNNRPSTGNRTPWMTSFPFTHKVMGDGAKTLNYFSENYLSPHHAGKSFNGQDLYYPNDRQPFNNSKNSLHLENIPLRSLPSKSLRSSYFEVDTKIRKPTFMTTRGQNHNMSSPYKGSNFNSNVYTSKPATSVVKFSSIPSDAFGGYKYGNNFNKKRGISFDTTLSELSTDLQTMDICRKALKSMREKEFQLLNKYLYSDCHKNRYGKNDYNINENHRKDNSLQSPLTDVNVRKTLCVDRHNCFSCGSSNPSERSSSMDEFKNCHLNKYNKLDERENHSLFTSRGHSSKRFDDDIVSKFSRSQFDDVKKSNTPFPSSSYTKTSIERRLLSKYGGSKHSTNASSFDIKTQPSSGSKILEEDWNESKKHEDYNCKTSLTPDQINVCSQKNSMLGRNSIFKDIELSCGLGSLEYETNLPKFKTSNELSSAGCPTISSHVLSCTDADGSRSEKNSDYPKSGVLMKYGSNDMKTENEAKAISNGYGNAGMHKEHGSLVNPEMKRDFGSMDMKKGYGHKMLEKDYYMLSDRDVSNDYGNVSQTKNKPNDVENGCQNDSKATSAERSYSKLGGKYFNCLDGQMACSATSVKRDFDININEAKTKISTGEASNDRFFTSGYARTLSKPSSNDIKRSCRGSCISPVMGTGSYMAAAPNFNKGTINAYISAETDRLINLNSIIQKSTNML